LPAGSASEGGGNAATTANDIDADEELAHNSLQLQINVPNKPRYQ